MKDEDSCCRGKGMHIFLAIAAILIAVLLFRIAGQKPSITVENNPEEMNAISVSGESEIEVMPDKAEVYVSIVTNSTSAKEAKDEAAEIFSRVKSALLKAGIKAENIESNSYAITPIYEWNDIFKRSDFKGYQVTHTIKVTTTEINKTGDIIDASVNAGANQIDSVAFDLSKELEKETYHEALTQAAALAKTKASSIADALGVKLGNVKTVSESSGYYTPYVNYYRSDISGSAEMAKSEIAPQKLTVTGRISVSYYIE
jgi:hypothetical protein